MVHAKATVSSKGQVVIPQNLREILGIHAGTELLLEVHDGVLEVKPIKKHSIEMFFGSCKKENELPMSVAEMDQAIKKAVLEHNAKPRRKSKK